MEFDLCLLLFGDSKISLANFFFTLSTLQNQHECKRPVKENLEMPMSRQKECFILQHGGEGDGRGYQKKMCNVGIREGG